MRPIAQLNLLLRVQAELPQGVKGATEEFREGWNFTRSVDARCPKKRVLTRGRSFINIEAESLRSGVGDTAQESIESALKLALRGINEHMNAVEMAHIELIQYPWYFLARVGFYPYRIQQDASVSLPRNALALPLAARRGRLPHKSNAILPQFVSAMPQLRQMLISSNGSENQ